MRMMGERRAPCVEDGGDTDPGAEVLRVGGDGEHRIGGGLEQQIIDQRLVVIGDRGNLGRQREHDVEIADREEISLARSEEHTSELQSLMRISYAVFGWKKKKETSVVKEIHQ